MFDVEQALQRVDDGRHCLRLRPVPPQQAVAEPDGMHPHGLRTADAFRCISFSAIRKPSAESTNVWPNSKTIARIISSPSRMKKTAALLRAAVFHYRITQRFASGRSASLPAVLLQVGAEELLVGRLVICNRHRYPRINEKLLPSDDPPFRPFPCPVPDRSRCGTRVMNASSRCS